MSAIDKGGACINALIQATAYRKGVFLGQELFL